MIQARAWPVRAIYILIAAALAISLFITAAPAQKVSGDCTGTDVCAEWETVPTPTMDGFVLAPESTIIDYALASDGEVAYAVVVSYDEDYSNYGYRLLKSDDHAATWGDITDALEDVLDEDEAITWISRVATDWEDPDFVAVALGLNISGYVYVFFSTDGGDNFINAEEVEDGSDYLVYISDLAVSYEAAGKREIAIGGVMPAPDAALFRCTVTGDSASAWEDATDYDGWDNVWKTGNIAADDIYSWVVTDIIFSTSWATDKTILVTTVADSNATGYQGVYLQSGSWGTSEGWNFKSTLGINVVPIKTNALADVEVPDELTPLDARGIAGITLPSNYNSKNVDTRVLWVWVNYYDSLNNPACQITRVDNDEADPVGPLGQIEDGELWLTNISYHGTIAEGEAIAGVLGDGGYPLNGSVTDLFKTCCVGVQVYRNNGIHNMDICCERWRKACKPPTGQTAMAVSYVGEDKAYAVALLGEPDYDEGAWSVTFDDGDTWNQISLIDTYIDYISDVAVSPDCNKTFLVSVNADTCKRGCGCDSVWLNAKNLPEAEEYSGQWLRTWCGKLLGDNDQNSGHGYFPWVPERGLLRLAPEETTGDTVFLVDRMTGDVYQNDLETLSCWDPIPSTEVDEIADLVALDADTLFALDWDGDVAMFDEDEWHEAVDSEVENGWTIAVHGDYILVGGQNGDVSYSDDGGETFTELEDVDDDSSAHVTVAFDTYFDTNDTIYAALANADSDNGIYLLVADNQTTEWHKTHAEPFNYTGLVLDRPSPANPMTSPETGGVLYASFYTTSSTDYNCDGCDKDDGGSYCWYSGVARCLTPITEICCGVGEADWDYLIWGLDPQNDQYATKFIMAPQALKICGCLTADSNSKLFAIDGPLFEGPCNSYDMDEGEYGTLWTFEDCYAKKAVELVSPADGFVGATDTCECCNAPFSIRWDRLCDACCYEIQFALDEDFTEIVYPHSIIDSIDDEGMYFDWYCPDAPMNPSAWIGCYFSPEFTYYWRVRTVEAETCQEILSWWSEPLSFTVAPSASAAAIDLVSPVPGALNQPTKNLGFSWDLTATADAFDWVLSKNADLSAPVDSKTGLANTACTYTGTLDYGTTYYWQVTAYNDGAAISASAVGTFTTAATGAFCCPIDGLCFATRAELEAHNAEAHPAQPATPFWVWVVIAIGAILVIVVIVLIFRTRRV
jgi:hypothetical protein